MIIDPPKPHSPFREGMDAETNLDPDRLSAPSQSTSAPSTSSYPPPTNAPPAYTNNGHASVGSSGFIDEKRAIPPQQPTGEYSRITDSGHPYAIVPQQATAPFSRPAPQQHYPSFEPAFLMASGQYLTRGFPALPPPSKTNPHPFASHDVSESDWLSFLQEVGIAGQLSEKQEHWARLPIVSAIPIVGSISTHVIRQQMKKGKSKAVASVIDNWNHLFFNPRRMEVTLMCGMAKLSGLGKHPTSHKESTPGWPGNALIESASAESNNGRGKAKQEEDTTYRLFIMPLYTSD